MEKHTPTALVTGASRGFGFAIALALAQRGWQLLINGRDALSLRKAQLQLELFSKVVAISGDVRDEVHLLQFAEVLERENWTLDLLINNASTLGASPQPSLLEYEVDALHHIYHTNVIAPLSLLQKVHPYLSEPGTIINISSDAAAEAYAGWGGYGASKAALDHWTAVLAKEQPNWRIYAFDPGDMRTRMHQEAFPEEDISDRPLPEEIAVPALLQLIYNKPESGRHTAQQWTPKPAVPWKSDYFLTMLK